MDEPPFEQRSVSQMSLYIEKRQRRKPTDLKGLCAREVVRLLRSKQQEIDSLAETVPAELLALLWSWDELPDLTFTHWEHAQGDTPLPQGSRKLYHDERKPAGGWALPCSAYKEFFRLLLVHTKRSPTESYSSHVPRGIPDDASTFVQSCAFRCDTMHHPSWLNFEELLHGDALRATLVQKAKAKDEREVRELVKKMYQREVEAEVVCVSPESYFSKSRKLYWQVTVELALRESIPSGLRQKLNELLVWHAAGDPECLRMVFWFE